MGFNRKGKSFVSKTSLMDDWRSDFIKVPHRDTKTPKLYLRCKYTASPPNRMIYLPSSQIWKMNVDGCPLRKHSLQFLFDSLLHSRKKTSSPFGNQPISEGMQIDCEGVVPVRRMLANKSLRNLIGSASWLIQQISSQETTPQTSLYHTPHHSTLHYKTPHSSPHHITPYTSAPHYTTSHHHAKGGILTCCSTRWIISTGKRPKRESPFREIGASSSSGQFRIASNIAPMTPFDSTPKRVGSNSPSVHLHHINHQKKINYNP